MLDVMVDLETLGNRPGCVVIAIGAVAFDPDTGELGPEFYQVINQQSGLDAGLHMDADTIAWWKKQSAQAQQVLAATCEDKGAMLPIALTEFSDYLRQFGDGVKLWGCGANFDQPILSAAYHAATVKQPWKFWNDRCYRTLKELFPTVPLSRSGTHHNALDDAKTQAVHAIAIFKRLQLTPAT
jgi:hypothetical protein